MNFKIILNAHLIQRSQEKIWDSKILNLFLRRLELTRSGNHDFLFGSTRLGSNALDGLDNVHSFDDRSENDVFSVKPRSLVGAQEKLGTVSVRTGVGHREDTGASMAELEVLVLEFVSVDRFASSTVVVCEVTSLTNNMLTT